MQTHTLEKSSADPIEAYFEYPDGLPIDRCKVFPKNLAFGLCFRYYLQHLQMSARPSNPQAAGCLYGSPVSIGRLGTRDHSFQEAR